MAERTLYEVLGVAPDASVNTIEDACTRLGKQYSPHLHPGDLSVKLQFDEIQEAYATLIDPKNRAEYDKRLRSAGHSLPRRRGKVTKVAYVTVAAAAIAIGLVAYLVHKGKPDTASTSTPSPPGPQVAQSSDSSSKAQPQEQRDQRPAEDPTARRKAELVEKAKTVIMAKLNDPQSIQLRNVFVVSDKSDKTGKPVEVVCGEYNAKNRFGGYVDFNWFIWSSESNEVTSPSALRGRSDFEERLAQGANKGLRARCEILRDGIKEYCRRHPEVTGC